MTPKQRERLRALDVRRSELTQFLHDPAATDSTGAQAGGEERAKWEKELIALEREWRGIYEAADDTREEPRVLRDRVEVRSYLQAARDGVALDGAEKELGEELRMATGGAGSEIGVPWSVLLDAAELREVREEYPDMEMAGRVGAPETRADVIATVQDSAVARFNQEVLKRVFHRLDASWCGAMMPSAPVGWPNYPVMTSTITGAAKVEGDAIDGETADFTGSTIAPTRLSIRFAFSMEQAQRFVGLEDHLRQDMRQAFGVLLDTQLMTSAAAAPNLNGWITRANAGAAFPDPAAVATIAALDTLALDEVDLLYNYSPGNIKLLYGIKVLKTLLYLKRYSNDYDKTLWANVVQGEWRASRFVAESTANSIEYVYTLDAAKQRWYAPVWQGFTLIRDPYTGADKAQVAVTGHAMYGSGIIRAGHKRKKIKYA